VWSACSAQRWMNSETGMTIGRFRDLDPGFYNARIDTEHKKCNHIRQREALSLQGPLGPAA
jgi:hypothetical protein